MYVWIKGTPLRSKLIKTVKFDMKKIIKKHTQNYGKLLSGLSKHDLSV
jgi:hypothetical protein